MAKGFEQIERRQCSAAGCVNKAQANGKCRTHTGGGQCSQPECEKQAQFKGLCVAHGGRRICTQPSCGRTAASKGKCSRHGGSRRRCYPDSVGRAEAGGKAESEITTSNQESMMSLLMGVWPQGIETNGGDQHVLHSNSNMSFGAADQYDSTKLASFEPSLVSTTAITPITSDQEKESHTSMMSLLLEDWPHEMAMKSDGSGGAAADTFSTSLSSEDTRPRKSRNRTRCSNLGCSKIAQSEGLCVSHGGKRCSHPGCIKGAQSKGLCIAHGGSKTCVHHGCTKMVRSAGRCFEHGGGKQCSHSGCVRQAQSSGRCQAHRYK